MANRTWKVKCFATGEFGSSADFVRIGGHWWKNEEVYKEYMKNLEYRRKAYELYGKIIGYETGQIFPGYIHKRFKKLEFYGWECIYQNMIECRLSMEWAITHKDFQNAIGEAAYMFAIMEGNINGCYKRMKKQKQDELLKQKHSEENEKYSNDVDLASVQSVTTKKRDISKWLEDDDE